MRVALAAAAVLVLATGATGGLHRPQSAGGTAQAVAIQVVVPGQSGALRGSVSAPPDAVTFGGAFAYPADGSAVSATSVTASASTTSGSDATSSASSEVDSLSLFGGEITAASVIGRAHGVTSGHAARGDFAGAAVNGLVVNGQAVSVAPNQRVELGDWGYALALEQSSATTGSPASQSYRGFVTALDVHLTAAHGGLPADSEIIVGYAEARVQAASAPPTPPTPPKATVKKKTTKAKRKLKAPEPKRRNHLTPPLVRPVPPGVTPPLTAGGYVFPVYGPSSFTDTFGAPRADVTYHHGDDIFAPLGAPLLACADGTIFSVGWNEIGGNRLWLRDAQGNEFYYAHLSAFSPLAVNGKHIRAGEVVGFVGNTGDAAGTPYHLHFEIHPVSLLYLGYDGAVDPTGYLTAWKHLQDVRFTAVAGWVPAVASSTPAPKPGAILLQVSDISAADGLDPGSLQRAVMAPANTEGEITLFRGPLG
jgi:murein DD-endopeptidase MepM/ murein hydrolase activator NlpD